MSKFCQSCGMPMKKDPENGGTNADGSKRQDYCSYCYRDGAFTSPEITTAAAMAMFLTLTTLPPGEPDLDEIIDKAGCFLLDQNDNSNATRLYRAATEAYPGVCEHWSSLSYCLGKAGQLNEAVSTARKALSLKENDPHVLNDLGWTLLLAGLHDEARSGLERAVALAPADDDLPRNNLRELERRGRGTLCRDPNSSGFPITS